MPQLGTRAGTMLGTTGFGTSSGKVKPAGVGRITQDGEALTQDGEYILSGTEDDVTLADALAALTGTVSIGGATTTITLAGPVNMTNAAVKMTTIPAADPSVAGRLFTTANAVIKSP